MAKDLKTGFEKEKVDGDSMGHTESPGVNIEKLNQINESRVEKAPGSIEKSGEEKKELEKSGEAVKTLSGKSTVSIAGPDLERQKQIDQILSEGLDDIFMNLAPIEQKKFKEEGERSVLKINELLNQTKIKIKKIIEIIKIWLKIIPKINRYFLEQEAKIKADKIIKLKK